MEVIVDEIKNPSTTKVIVAFLELSGQRIGFGSFVGFVDEDEFVFN